ncbi:glycogen synthase [Boudabousia marimammalium]|uniref:Glycosyl transferase family 1 n=1 Tax=Boudabousia marimammalium TaxID=156892 RepID=A0A1Q5PR95_9ACTO|nr:glycogen synthase [Boudabousia marimammalium]OKL50066.1 glycosyl transferase family 1 [Boudabousia marimammalium]
MRVDLLTREFPPHVYGGAGVHVEELSKVLAEHVDVHVHAFDGPRTDNPSVSGYSNLSELKDANPALQSLGVDLQMAAGATGADLVHSHTWYANMAGHWASLLHGVPHVISAHSLEPLRPWKAEQLGGGYQVSLWAEKTAYLGAAGIIAVSNGMRDDILRCYPEIDPAKVHVVHNGIDLESWLPDHSEAGQAHAAATLERLGIKAGIPTVVFVGRITRQKGLPYLLRALHELPPQVQIILCAGAPDTEEIMREVVGLVDQLREERGQVIWVEDMLPRRDLVAVLDNSTVFVTPSVYEPLGIVNLEAMAVSLPVVGTATGGIPDVIVDGETGVLVPIEQAQDGTGTPLDPDKFVADLAAGINRVLADPQLAKQMGESGRRRVEEHFSWASIAERTVAVYETVLAEYNK